MTYYQYFLKQGIDIKEVGQPAPLSEAYEKLLSLKPHYHHMRWLEVEKDGNRLVFPYMYGSLAYHMEPNTLYNEALRCLCGDVEHVHEGPPSDWGLEGYTEELLTILEEAHDKLAGMMDVNALINFHYKQLSQ